MNVHTYSTYTERAEALSRSFGGAGRKGADLPMEQIEPLAAWNTLPESALLLGFGEDNVPLMLDLHSPAAGSVLVAGDRGCGKTNLLRMLALQTETVPYGADMQFTVLTHNVDDWADLEPLPGCMGILPARHAAAGNALARLTAWGDHPLDEGRLVTLLLIDGLDSLALSDATTRQYIQWLFVHGASRRILPVVTCNAGRLPRYAEWMRSFDLLLFGHIRQPNLAAALTGGECPALEELAPFGQFCLHKPEGWLRLWLPTAIETGRQA